MATEAAIKSTQSKIDTTRRRIDGLLSELSIAQTILDDVEKVESHDSKDALVTEAYSIANRAYERLA